MNTDIVWVHIISHPTQDRTEQMDAMLEQLEGEPVKVVRVPGVDRMIGAGRYAGYMASDGPIVSYVDDDDEIVPGAFDHILECFAREPGIDGCCTREHVSRHASRTVWGETCFPFQYYDRRHLHRVHHITAWKKAAIMPYLDEIKDKAVTAEHHLVALMLKNNARIKHIPHLGYRWNEHKGSSPSMGIEQDPRSLALYREVKQMAANEKYVPHIPEQCTLKY